MAHPTWEEVQYARCDVVHPGADAFVQRLTRSYCNGSVNLSRLTAVSPRDFDAAARFDLRGGEHRFRAFLNAESTLAGLSGVGLKPSLELPPHRTIGAFDLEGALTQLLVVGGAYGGYVPEDSARALARQFVSACFADRYLQVVVYAIDVAWTDWFYDVAWDHTYIAFDPGIRSWTCLFATDTD